MESVCKGICVMGVLEMAASCLGMRMVCGRERDAIQVDGMRAILEMVRGERLAGVVFDVVKGVLVYFFELLMLTAIQSGPTHFLIESRSIRGSERQDCKTEKKASVTRGKLNWTMLGNESSKS